jgi:subtilase family serine protease
VNDSQVTTLKGDVHPRARAEFDRGPLAASTALQQLLLSLKPSPEQQTSLNKLLADLQNPAAPKYHQWLTPEQFGDQFGASNGDYEKTVAWLTSRGFTVTERSRSRTWIAFSGTASQVAQAFHTQIHQYQVNGTLQYANSSEPTIPSALAPVVMGVRLHNFKPRARAVSRKLKPNFTSNQTQNHFLAPDDFATIYDLHGLYNAGIDGTGQKIAVMGQTDVDLTNVTTFRTLSGLPTSTPTKIPIGTASTVTSDLDEAYLDIEWAGAVARKAQIIYIHSDSAQGSGVFDALNYAITNNTAPVISISYGDCEPNFAPGDLTTLAGWLQQANAQGQTVVGPAGDDGAADCDYVTSTRTSATSAIHGFAVDIPSSFPYVTSVGGTTFNEGSATYWNTGTNNNSVYGSVLSYIPETAWNDTLADIGGGSTSFAATGGGKSSVFSKPAWQTGIGVPSDDARFVPDIALAASVDHDGYLTCTPGFCVNPTTFPDGFRDANNSNLSVVGGTSAGVPTFAGIVALINQKKGQRQGNINPTLYSLAATLPSAFHDVTMGDNKVPCTAGTTDCPGSGGTLGYGAGVGYDPTTGLGTIDGSALVNGWIAATPAQDFTILNTNSSMSLTHGTSDTVSLNFYPENGFTGSLTLSCTVASTLGSTTCTLPNPPTVASNAAVTVKINAASTLATIHKGPGLFGWESNLVATFGIVFVVGAGSRRRKALTLGVVLFVLIILLVACGGGSSSTVTPPPPTNPLTGTVTVNATNGTISHSTVIHVTVN